MLCLLSLAKISAKWLIVIATEIQNMKGKCFAVWESSKPRLVWGRPAG